MKQWLDRPLVLRKKTLPSSIWYAPLAGCSDFPFRQMAAPFRPGLLFCEMVKMEALIRLDPKTFRYLDYAFHTRPIGAQLCGSNPKIAGQAAKIIENLGFDLVDLNCGCPVDKVTKDGSGSGLLKEPARIGEILQEMVAAVQIPVTLKIRAGWDESRICVEEVVQIAEQAGASAITVHGRTREQGYSGPANREYIRRAKVAARSILVLGNGDILDPASALSMWEETGCDGILVARGTLGAPWIAEEIRAYLRGETKQVDELARSKQALQDHFFAVCRYHAPHKVPLEMRRIGCWYLKKGAFCRELRSQMSRVGSVEEIAALLC